MPLGRGIFLAVTLGNLLFVAFSVFRGPVPITWSTAAFLGYLVFVAACAKWPRWQVFVDLARAPEGAVIVVIDAMAKAPDTLPTFPVLVSCSEESSALIARSDTVELGLRVGSKVPAFGRAGHRAMAQLCATFAKHAGHAPRFFRPVGPVGFALRAACKQHDAAVVLPAQRAKTGQTARDLLDKLGDHGGVVELPAAFASVAFVEEFEAEIARRGLRIVGLDAAAG